MNDPRPQLSFAGSVPEIYDRHLVPMIFDVYAADLARRARATAASSVLEIAAGTGAVTRRLAAELPDSVSLVASDLSPAMLEHARSVGTARPVEWRVADAMDLPFPDGSFDAVVCQFGVMFFPDRVHAYREIRRVLRPGGTFLFNVWDRMEHNDFAHVLWKSVAAMYPDDEPTFLPTIPHGYHDEVQIRGDLAAAGFSAPVEIDPLEAVSRADSNEIVAKAYCQGTPMRNFLEAHGADHVQRATEVASTAIADAFGERDLEGRISAFVVAATSPPSG